MVALILLVAGCGAPSVQVGDFAVDLSREGALTVTHLPTGSAWEDVRFLAGKGDAEVEMQFGSFRFTETQLDLTAAGGFGRVRGRSPVTVAVEDAEGDDLATLLLRPGVDGALHLELTPLDPDADRLGWSAACDEEDHFLGLGGHAMDVDHAGEAFPLWVSEPGIGKSETDEPGPDWFLTGTRHASSYPVPFLLRPHRAQGLLVDSTARVEVDLCASDTGRFSAVAWQGGTLATVLFAGWSAVDPIRSFSEHTGRYELPPPWVFAPWNDAVRGPERVREVAATLREAGAPSSAIWTEDWKGATEGALGYHLGGEWRLDEELYPDAAGLAEELEDQGFSWLAYFAPFVRSGTEAWEEAVAAGVLVHDADGEVYTFPGVTLEEESLLDLTDPAARAWAQERMQAALDLGFDGWMADYAEWLPTDAVLADGSDAALGHNAYPQWWQETNAEVAELFFVRSGWTRTAGQVPVVWAGDQRTSFSADDGLPSVVAMGLGLGASGVPVFTHDVAGYQSVGNPPSDKELWFRWASLGAFTPILRTHHGAFETENWQFDSDAETLAHWTAVAREHTRLFPYRYGLAARAAKDGTPMVLPVAVRFDGGDWGRTDAWMLGDALLVAPVVERGATGRNVTLPDDLRWYDWFTRREVVSGWFPAGLAEIPVFAAEGTTVPTFAEAPDTLRETAAEGLTTLTDADRARVVYLFGGGGPFTEADGTTYTPSGEPTAEAEVTASLTAGEVDVGGVTVAVEGTVARTYTFVVVP